MPSRPPSAAVARLVADAVRAVPGVVDLDAGPLGTRMTYGSDGRVPGVTVHDGHPGRLVSVYLQVAWGPVRAVAAAAMDASQAVLESAWPEAGPWRTDVEVADIAVDPSDAASGSTGSAEPAEPRPAAAE